MPALAGARRGLLFSPTLSSSCFFSSSHLLLSLFHPPLHLFTSSTSTSPLPPTPHLSPLRFPSIDNRRCTPSTSHCPVCLACSVPFVRGNREKQWRRSEDHATLTEQFRPSGTHGLFCHFLFLSASGTFFTFHIF